MSINTGEKPQSKVWKHDGKYWSVLSDNTGTYLWRLDDKAWTKVLQLSEETSVQADCKTIGNIAHILLFRGTASKLVSVEYLPATNTYELWSVRPEAVNITLDSGVETATLEVDGTGRMWIASDGNSKIYVRWGDSPYSIWSAPYAVASNIKNDDLCAIVALPGKIGVLWSNQNTKRFGFRTHTDGESPTTWQVDEVPASQSADDVQGGMADDHLNMAVADDGTLYCAVKTSFDTSILPAIAMLVRRPNGTWDDLYEVASRGTRPIAILNQEANKVVIVYTSSDSGGDILYNESSTTSIAFGSAHVLLKGKFNNPTSTKSNYSDDALILASTTSSPVYAVGTLALDTSTPLPVELLSFTAKRTNDNAVLEWATASETNNGYFSIEVSLDGKNYSTVGLAKGKGTTSQKSHYAFTDNGISRYGADKLYYRLRQVDFSGEFSFSHINVVYPGALPEALAVQAFPNPFDDILELVISSQEQKQAILILYNTQGKVVYSDKLALSVGENHVYLQQLHVPQGVYFLKVSANDQQQVLKLVQH
ncbi:T9SS type A sorting domain-containing protein [uncultured Pontibacter sp.]|uniref:T9SS type A sorting domain-containing protein n=1 Tax=uncultured Pontibacter sp. TaxID=453356 RepID=UPI002619A875|nr:T9SS type A sorting domain-containing protein [uncultured Pontibacter sp.]